MSVQKAAAVVSCFVVLLGVSVMATCASAQSRVNDKDMESLMRNLRDDAKSFQPVFNDSVKHSVVRKTSQEKDARALAERFTKQTEAMLNSFKHSRKADQSISAVMSSAVQLNKLVYDLKLNPQTVSRWEKVRSELSQVANAYGIPDPLTAQTAAEDFGENGPACSHSVGAARAQTLVEECLQVSPATHPPCNAQNACSLITSEIRRGCAMLSAASRPGFCAEYR